MKKIILTILLAAVTLGASAQSGRNFYKKYSGREGVSTVYISPFMFKVMGKVAFLSDNDMDIRPIVKSLKGMYIVDCSNPLYAAEMRKDAEEFLDKGRFELLMEANDDEDSVRMFAISDGAIVNNFIMLVFEPDGTTFISLEGEIPLEALEKKIAQSSF